MRYAKWILAAGLLAVTAACTQTSGYPYSGYRGSSSGPHWNAPQRDVDRSNIPARYDRNRDGVPDRYQRPRW